MCFTDLPGHERDDPLPTIGCWDLLLHNCSKTFREIFFGALKILAVFVALAAKKILQDDRKGDGESIQGLDNIAIMSPLDCEKGRQLFMKDERAEGAIKTGDRGVD